MTLKRIIEVCKVRHVDIYDPLPCTNCQYHGSTCEHAKKVLKGKKPFEYNPMNTDEQKED